MKKIISAIFMLAATAALSSCVVDEGGNRNLNAYQLRNLASSLVDASVTASVNAINQMVLEGRDINAEGFTAKAADGILLTRTEQDCWAVTGQNALLTFSLTMRRDPVADGYDSWHCYDVQGLHDEKGNGFAKLSDQEIIRFDWITQTGSNFVSSRLEQTGLYRVEFFADPHATTCTDWCTLIYEAGELDWITSRGEGGYYYE